MGTKLIACCLIRVPKENFELPKSNLIMFAPGYFFRIIPKISKSYFLCIIRYIRMDLKSDVMSLFRGFLFSLIFLFCHTVVYPQSPGGKKIVLDDGVERLIGQSKYRDASGMISAKLKRVPAHDIDRLLYYCNRQSIVQMRLRNIDSALMFAKKSLAFSARSTDSTLVADAWKVAAFAYNNVGKLDSALYFTRQMLQFGERNGDDKLTRNALISMASILSQNKRYGEAIHYYRDAYALTVKVNDTANFSLSLFNLGLTLLNLKKPTAAWFVCGRQQKLLRKTG
jgi:tetratricopeptide (TPR) repeat protein